MEYSGRPIARKSTRPGRPWKICCAALGTPCRAGARGPECGREARTMPQPSVYLVRHGETTWALTGQHTGRTDIPLTDRGEADGRRLGARLAGRTFARVWSSPAARAWRTCEL